MVGSLARRGGFVFRKKNTATIRGMILQESSNPQISQKRAVWTAIIKEIQTAAHRSKMGIKNPEGRIFFIVDLCSPSLTNWDGSAGVMDC